MDEIEMKWKASRKFLQRLQEYKLSHTKNNDFNLQLPPIRSKYCAKDIETWEVKNLSDKIFCDLRPSTAVARMVERDRKQQNEALMDMDKELKEIIQEAEKAVRYERDVFNCKMDSIISTSQKIVHNLCESAVRLLQETEFHNSWREVKVLYLTAMVELDSFYEILLTIEKKRIEKTKVVFRRYYQILRNIRYLLPYDLQKFFEEKILKMNQMTQDNLRCHADLREHLLMLLAKMILMLKSQIKQHRMSWVAPRTTLASVRKCDSFKIDIGSDILKTISSSDFTRRMDNTLRRITDLLARWQGQPFVQNKPSLDLTSSMETAIKNLSGTIENLLSLYKQALVNMYTGVYGILASLHQDIENTHIYSSDTTSSMDLIVSRTFDMSSEHMTNVETMSSEVMLRLQIELKNLFRFVFEASAPWAYRSSRSLEARCLLQQQIKKLIYSNVQVSDKEQRFNILLDSMRQESNEEKLSKTLETVINCLNDIMSSYEEDFEKEKSVVEEYYNLVETQYQLLSSEVELFQLRNPQESFIAYHNMKPEQEEQSIYIPQALRMCEAQMTTLHKWRYGLWEGIKFATDNAFQEIEEHTYSWVTSNISKAWKRFELKMMLHTPRYERVLYEIFLVRQAELIKHMERLDMHKGGMLKIFSEMTVNLEKLASKHRDSFEEEKKKFEETWEQKREIIKLTNVTSFASQVDGLAKKYIEEADNILSQYEEWCFCKHAWLQESNLAFLQSIRLFSEGGNFCPETVGLIVADIELLNKVIITTKDNIKKQIKKHRVSLPQEISTSIKTLRNKLQLLLVDLRFVDKVVKLIKLCQEDIKSEVFGLKYKGKVLHQQAFEAVSAVPEEDVKLLQTGIEKTVSPFQNKSQVSFELTQSASKKKSSSCRLKMSQADIYLENRSFMLHLGQSRILKPQFKTSNIILNQDKKISLENISSKKKVLEKQPSLQIRSKQKSSETLSTHSEHKLQEGKSTSVIYISPSDKEKEFSVLRCSSSLCEQKSSPIMLSQSNQSELINNMEYQFRRWTELLESLIERRNYLLQPTVLTPQGNDTEMKTMSLQLKYSSQNAMISEKNMPPLVVGSKSYLNYQSMLFGSTDAPPCNKSFICHICYYLCNTFNEVQQITAEYFAEKGSEPIIKTEYIQPTYDLFMEDMLKKLKNYQQQCEKVWIQQVQDFIELVLKIQAAAAKYREQYINSFHGNRVKIMKEYLATVTLKVNEEIQKSSETLEILKEKLKPLHGYPGNKKLLEALNIEVVTTAQSLKENVASVVSKSKVDTAQMCDLASLEMQTVSTTCGSVLLQLLNPDILKDLENQKEAYYATEDIYITSQEESVKKSAEDASSQLQKQRNKSKAKEKESAEINPDINRDLERKLVPTDCLSLDSKKLNAEVGSSQMQIPQLQRELVATAEDTEQIKESSSQPPLSTNAEINEYMQMFKETVDIFDAQQSLYENKTERWLQIWNMNVEKVKQLYNVKLSECQIRYKQNLNTSNE